MYQSAVFPFYKGGRLLGPRPLELLELSKSTQSTYGCGVDWVDLDSSNS